jgi:hypothetical protein
MSGHLLRKFICLAFVASVTAFGQSPYWPYAFWPFQTPPPRGDGATDDTAAIQNALNAAAADCATVQLACTAQNTYVVSSTIHVPKCVKFIGACGAVPFEGSETTIGTTLKWVPAFGKLESPAPETGPVPSEPVPVVSFHDSPGATMSGVSIDCQNSPLAIGILYDSDNNPTSSFLNVDNLMIKGCHQAFVVGLPGSTATAPAACVQNEAQPGCTQADSFKFERYRILGNLSDLTGEGIHINSSNGAQSSLIFNGNIQGVNIGIHVVSTNQGLIVENTDTGSPLGADPAFIVIEPTVGDSPTLINNEVEGNTAAVIDHGNNPFGTPGNPVWLNNTWNNHPIVVDGSEHITSMGNLLNQGTIASEHASVMSIDETGWSLAGTATAGNLGIIGGLGVSRNGEIGGSGGAGFGASLTDEDVIMAENSLCPGFPPGHTQGDLVSCEGAHAGRIFLGGDLLLANNGNPALSIGFGLDQNGSGLKHQTVATASIPPASSVQVTLEWQSPFRDANYQAFCSVVDDSGFLQVMNTSAPTPSEVTAVIRNSDSSTAHTGSLACFAIHD